MSDNEIYLLIKYIKSVLWRVAKRLSYKQDARCLKVNVSEHSFEKKVYKYKEDIVKGEIDKIIKKYAKIFTVFVVLLFGFWLFNGYFQLPNSII